MKNPFIFGKIVSGEHFIDRESELDRLTTNILGNINTVLISPRRWGKSSLVMKTANVIEKKNDEYRFCFIDMFNIRTEEEFYSQLANELLRISYSKWEERVQSAKKFFRQITPAIQIGIDPASDFTISFNWKEVKKTPDEILNLPEKISKERKIKIVVCIDEFQNTEFFEHPIAFQKKLRTHWQRHNHAVYCLYGSKRHLMMQLFESKSMPFYKFGDTVFLSKIPENYWVEYISSNFNKTKKNIHDKLAREIAREMENHPYFVQQLAFNVWNYTLKQCTSKELSAAKEMLLRQQTILFQREIESLTNSQINFLKALCENVVKLSSSETIKSYNLGTSANVNRIKNSLISKEVIDITNAGIEFIDPLFKLWFETIYLKQI